MSQPPRGAAVRDVSRHHPPSNRPPAHLFPFAPQHRLVPTLPPANVATPCAPVCAPASPTGRGFLPPSHCAATWANVGACLPPLCPRAALAPPVRRSPPAPLRAASPVFPPPAPLCPPLWPLAGLPFLLLVAVPSPAPCPLFRLFPGLPSSVPVCRPCPVFPVRPSRPGWVGCLCVSCVGGLWPVSVPVPPSPHRVMSHHE